MRPNVNVEQRRSREAFVTVWTLKVLGFRLLTEMGPQMHPQIVDACEHFLADFAGE